VATVLTIRVQDPDLEPPLTVLCAGYELEEWRAAALVDDLFQRHLASFALSYTDFESIDGQNAARALKRAAQVVYNTDKYKSRGEFGELILHAALVDFFGALPAVSKIYYKDSDNDTVKGFDSVHIVEQASEIEIWLGEAKFYSDSSAGIRAALASLGDHLDRDFLRREFNAITNKLDPVWPHSEVVRSMLDEAVSLDEIADSLVLPVLVTYDSSAVDAWKYVCDDYIADLRAEALAAWEHFDRSKIAASMRVSIRLILVPLKSKADLVARMHAKLAIYQAL